MKITHKKGLQKIHKNLSSIFTGKTKYLKSLEKKKNDGIKILKEQKKGLIIEDLLKLNKFKRDYSCFPFKPGYEEKIIPLNIHFSQEYQYPIQSRIEKDYNYPYYKKYNNQFTQLENIPVNNNNYSEFPKSYVPIRYAHNIKNYKNKILENVGKQIIVKSGKRNLRERNLIK